MQYERSQLHENIVQLKIKSQKDRKFLEIGMYKKSIDNISNFITSPDLTYEKLSSEFDSLILEHQNFNDFIEEVDDKLFITPAYSYKGTYGWAVEGLKDIAISNIDSNSTFKDNRQSLNDNMEWLMNPMNDIFYAIIREIIFSLFIAIIEITMVISIGTLNKKNSIEN